MQSWSDMIDEEEADQRDGFCHIPCVGDEIRITDMPSRYRVMRVICKRKFAVVVDIYRPGNNMRVPFERIEK